MKNYSEQINDFVEEKREEILDEWKQFVNIESFARDKAGVNEFANKIKLELEELDMDVKLVDVGKNGNTLIGCLGDCSNSPVIFSGHMDTVFKKGLFGKNPFRIENDRAYGPGVLDMKGGILIALYVIKTLKHIGVSVPLKMILSGDEEIGHENSKGCDVFQEAVKGGLCAFNMETGLVDNCLCIGRKGRIGCEVIVEGVEAHAGNDFSNGRNAIEEMAHKIIDIQKLTDLKRGITVSVSVIKGGNVPNAIPKDCSIQIDVRIDKIEDVEKIKKDIVNICNNTYVEGTVTKVNFLSGYIPFEADEKVLKFLDFVNQVCEENGYTKFGSKKLGGSSDACYIAREGVPVLCSTGVRGEWNHTDREYALVESIFERIKILTTVLVNIDKYTY